jgi:hypothetical protein
MYQKVASIFKKDEILLFWHIPDRNAFLKKTQEPGAERQEPGTPDRNVQLRYEMMTDNGQWTTGDSHMHVRVIQVKIQLHIKYYNEKKTEKEYICQRNIK